jgi:hypothetical protein
MEDLPSQLESFQAQMASMQAHLTTILWVSTVLSFVFALASAYVAVRRGHNALRWAMLGALLGPIALLVVVLMPSAKVAAKTCPDCAESVKVEAAKCRFCGYRFDQPEIVPRIN